MKETLNSRTRLIPVALYDRIRQLVSQYHVVGLNLLDTVDGLESSLRAGQQLSIYVHDPTQATVLLDHVDVLNKILAKRIGVDNAIVLVDVEGRPHVNPNVKPGRCFDSEASRMLFLTHVYDGSDLISQLADRRCLQISGEDFTLTRDDVKIVVSAHQNCNLQDLNETIDKLRAKGAEVDLVVNGISEVLADVKAERMRVNQDCLEVLSAAQPYYLDRQRGVLILFAGLSPEIVRQVLLDISSGRDEKTTKDYLEIKLGLRDSNPDALSYDQIIQEDFDPCFDAFASLPNGVQRFENEGFFRALYSKGIRVICFESDRDQAVDALNNLEIILQCGRIKIDVNDAIIEAREPEAVGSGNFSDIELYPFSYDRDYFMLWGGRSYEAFF
jgi:hypothetical protein